MRKLTNREGSPKEGRKTPISHKVLHMAGKQPLANKTLSRREAPPH